VPLLLRAYQLWSELAQESGHPLCHECGLLQIGPPTCEVVRGVVEAARQHHLDIELWAAEAAHRRFPAFVIPDGMEAVFERRAGYLEVEAAIKAHVEAARRCGAELELAEVLSWSAARDGVHIQLAAHTIAADQLVIAAGPWSGRVLGALGTPLEVLRKPVVWFEIDEPKWNVSAGCPAFLYQLARGVFYGVPAIDARGVKLGEHTGGEPVGDASAVDRRRRNEDVLRLVEFAREVLPGVSARVSADHTCLYTMSRDRHFLVDFHPNHPQVVFAAGLSGHGFKFTGVLGEVLADLVTKGRTDLPIGFLRLARFGGGSAGAR
jgi:monomeric sarcosine oxidase